MWCTWYKLSSRALHEKRTSSWQLRCRVPLHNCCADLPFQFLKRRSISRAIFTKRVVSSIAVGRKLDSGVPADCFV